MPLNDNIIKASKSGQRFLTILKVNDALKKFKL